MAATAAVKGAEAMVVAMAAVVMEVVGLEVAVMVVVATAVAMEVAGMEVVGLEVAEMVGEVTEEGVKEVVTVEEETAEAVMAAAMAAVVMEVVAKAGVTAEAATVVVTAVRRSPHRHSNVPRERQPHHRMNTHASAIGRPWLIRDAASHWRDRIAPIPTRARRRDRSHYFL